MEILLILGLILLNGALAMSEASMIASQRTRLKQRAEGGHPGAVAALELSESPTRFLSTVQVGITLIGILSGAIGEASIASDIRRWAESVPVLQDFSLPFSLAVVVLGITFLSVVLGELVPKRLAMMAPEAIAQVMALPMKLLSVVVSPAVLLLSGTTNLLLRPFSGLLGKSAGVTSEEINIMLEEGAKTGEFEPEERRLIERVLHLGDQRIDALMIHRTEMAWIDLATPIEKARHVAKASLLTHFPVCKGTVDKIVGVVGLRDLLPGEGPGPADLKSIARPPVFVPESAPALRVLDRCRQSQTPVAFVVDEYGSVQGEVTVERILDRLVGRVWSGTEAGGAGGQAVSGTKAAHS